MCRQLLRPGLDAPHGAGGDVTSATICEAGSRVRLVTESEFRRASDGVLLASAEITCTPVNIDTGRVMRKWPDGVENAMLQVFGEDVPEFLECAARRRPRLISTAVEQSVP
jgi:hypothetical protein